MHKDFAVSVIIINYQTWQATLELVKSLGIHDEIEIIVVDNGPDDALKAPLTSQHPHVRYVAMEKNVGYAAAINEGMKHAKREWIMVLNNDMGARGEQILDLIRQAEKMDVLVAAPRLIKANDAVQDNVGYFEPWNKNMRNAIFARPRLINASEMKEPTKLDLATGGAVLFHRTVIDKIGEWDSRFFMYFEDIDFGYRLKKAGMPVLYVPSITFTHLKGFTANRDPKAKIKNYDRARAKYLKKHRGVFIKIINDFLNLY